MKQKLVPHARKLTLLAVSAMLAACGGGGGGDGGSEGRLQVINFKYPGGNTLLNGPTVLSATATSGLEVSYRTGTPTTCTVSGNQLSLVAAGECLVIASQAGGAGADGVKWASADDVSQLFNVLKKAQTPAGMPVGAVLLAASDTVELPKVTDANQPVAYVSTSPGVCTVSGTTLTLSAVGVCNLTASAPEAAQHEAMSVSGMIAVDAVPPMLVQTAGKTQRVALASVSASGEALTHTSETPTVCTVSGRDLQVLAQGTCRVKATASGGEVRTDSLAVDPRFFSTGFNSALRRTAEFGEINFSAGNPLSSWCDPGPGFCKLGVTPTASTFNYEFKPATLSGWTGSTAGFWSYYNYDIGAPRKRQTAADGSFTYEWQAFDVATEGALYISLGVNAPLFQRSSDLFVRIRTNHQGKNGDGSACYVTASVHLHPTSADPKTYRIPFSDFAVTNRCDFAALPQTEGWMFDWGVSAESKAAALAEIRAHGIRAIELSPGGGMNLTKPTPNADGSIPAAMDPNYTLSTSMTVYGPIAVQ